MKKECSKCHQIKEFDEFHKCRKNKLGIKSACKECRNKDKHNYYQRKIEENSNYFFDKNKTWRNKKLQEEPEFFRNKLNEWRFKRIKENPDYYKNEYYKYYKKSLERARRYYKRNRDVIIVRMKEWRKNNYNIYINSMKKWRENNTEVYRKSHRQWCRKNTEYIMVYNQERRALKRNVTIQKFTYEDLNKRVSVFGHKCAYCNGKFEHIDHVIPLSKGGFHCLANLRPSCRSCNLSKHNKSLKDWQKIRKIR